MKKKLGLGGIIDALAEYRTQQFEFNRGAFKSEEARKNYLDNQRERATQRLKNRKRRKVGTVEKVGRKDEKVSSRDARKKPNVV